MVKASLAVTGGVYEAVDAVKAIMAGADCVQMVSALLRYGPNRLRPIRREFERWVEEHNVSSLEEMRGRVSLGRSADPAAFERGNYVRLLQAAHKPGVVLVDH